MKKITLLIAAMFIASLGFVQAQILNDFESGQTFSGWSGNSVGSVIVDPTDAGNTVGKYVKYVGWWEGVQTAIPASDFSATTGLSVRIYSYRAGTRVMLKLENAPYPYPEGVNPQEYVMKTTGTGWETLVYDFQERDGTPPDYSYNNAIFFIEPGIDVVDSILVDDLELVTITQSSDGSAHNILIDGVQPGGFHPGREFTYVQPVPAGDPVPVVTVEAQANASVTIVQAADIDGLATIDVVSEDGTQSTHYEIDMQSYVNLTECAPAVSIPAGSDVIGIFSDAISVIGANMNPNWGQSTTLELVECTAEDTVALYSTLNYQGIEFANQNVSTLEYVHFDMWTPNASAIDFYLISPGQESPYALPITQGSWVSYDIPLSTWESTVNLANVFQFKFDAQTAGDSPIFAIDNIYFHGVNLTDDVSLGSLTVNGVAAVIVPGQLEYDVLVPVGTTSATVVAVANDNLATAVVTDATELPGVATVVVTAEDGVTTGTYTINIEALNAQALPLTFENGPYAIENFNGAVLSIIDNPQVVAGENESATVAHMAKAGWWSGAVVYLDAPIDFSLNSVLTMMTYSTRTGADVLLKLESTNGVTAPTELHATTTVADGWETLEFDFAGAVSGAYDKVVLFLDGNNAGTDGQDYTILIDNITWKAGAGEDLCPTDTDGNGATGMPDLLNVAASFGTACP